LHDCAQESSDGWNNAGIGHAANCELNYTPQRNDGSVDISKALEVNTEFDFSRQLWSFLVRKGAIPECLHSSMPAHKLRLGRCQRRFPARTLQGDVGAPLLLRHGI
jgi:L-2-hydroxyglutarate oxidase LhgO